MRPRRVKVLGGAPPHSHSNAMARRPGGGRMGDYHSSDEELSFSVHSDSSDEHEALFSAALGHSSAPSIARGPSGQRGLGASPSPRKPPPTRSLSGATQIQAPANPPPVQMPTDDGALGGLGGGRSNHSAGMPSAVLGGFHASPSRAPEKTPDHSVVHEQSIGGFSEQVQLPECSLQAWRVACRKC